MADLVNCRSHYKAEFEDGAFSIYWCAQKSDWIIGYTNDVGKVYCPAIASTQNESNCVHNTGWEWNIATPDWLKAERSVSVRCIDQGKY